MAIECHDSNCSRLSYTATSCQCGFTARLLAGQADVTVVNRGKGGCQRYLVPLTSSSEDKVTA